MEWELALFLLPFHCNLAAGNKEEKLVPHDQSFPQLMVRASLQQHLNKQALFKQTTAPWPLIGSKQGPAENTRVENFWLCFFIYLQGFSHTVGS